MLASKQIAFGKAAGGGLPDGVIPVEYLESTGTQWIDTLVNPLVSPTVHIGMELINSADKDYFGNTNRHVNGASVFIANFENYKLQYYRYASGNPAVATDVISTGTFHDLVVGKSVYVDGALTYTSPNTYIHDASQTNIILFSSGRDRGSNAITALLRCSYFKMYDGETVVRDFIPVLDLNNTPCMYDKVSGEFFYNQGTGEFVAGPEITEE